MGDDLVEVHLRRLPVPLHAESAEHMDALDRELELIRLAAPQGDAVPHRLHRLVQELQQRYGGVGDQPVAELQQAVDRGDAEIDLVYRVPEHAGAAAERLGAILDEADRYCRAGEHLLTLSTPPHVVRYRRWFLGEFRRQTIGLSPTAWPDFAGDGLVEGTPDQDERLDSHRLDVVAHGWQVLRDDGRVTVRLADDLDTHSAAPLRAAVNDLRAEGVTQLTLDLGATGFVDSAGLSVLVSAHTRLAEDGGELQVVLPEKLRRLIAVTGLDGHLHLRFVESDT